MRETIWTRQRSAAPARETLSREQIVKTAMEVLDGEGVAGLSMPKLAGWRSGALLFGHSLRSAVLRHPWLPEVMYTRPSIGPNAMALGERGLVLFGAAGFVTPHEVDLAMGSVMSYVLGTVSAEVATREMVRKSGRSEESWVSEMLEQAQSVA